MAHDFPSAPWAAAYHAAINANDGYRAAARAWTHGPVAIVCRAEPGIGLQDDVGIWLDLGEGACHGATLVSAGEASRAAFCLGGTYARWKAVLRRELDPIRGIMLGQLELQGDLGIVVRNIRVAQELVQSASMVPTRFLDE